MRYLSVFLLETKSFVTNWSALFWTVLYPVMMLAFLVVLFDPGDETSASFRFASVIGLTMLTLISMAIYGLAQALGDSRAHNALLFYAIAPIHCHGDCAFSNGYNHRILDTVHHLESVRA
ncbi:TPA: hypothetical protein ACNU26_003735 [Aeromonas salmonicida]